MYIPDVFKALHLYAIYAEGYSIIYFLTRTKTFLVSVNKKF